MGQRVLPVEVGAEEEPEEFKQPPEREKPADREPERALAFASQAGGHSGQQQPRGDEVDGGRQGNRLVAWGNLHEAGKVEDPARQRGGPDQRGRPTASAGDATLRHAVTPTFPGPKRPANAMIRTSS